MGKRTYVRSGGTWVDVTTGAAFPASSTAPTSPVTGQVYFDTDDQKPYIWDGTAWVAFVSGDQSLSTLRITSTGDASASGTTHGLEIGNTAGENIRIDGNEIMAVNNGSPSSLGLNSDGGNVTIGANTSGLFTLRRRTPIRFDDGDGSHYVEILAPNVVTTNVSYNLPVADGAANHVLTTDGSANLSWAAASGGGIVATVEDATTSLNLATTHLNDLVRMTSSSANSVNVTTSLNTLADGSMIHIQQAGTGKTTIVAGASVTVTGTPTLGLRARYSAATLIKIGGTGTNVWTLVGDLSA